MQYGRILRRRSLEMPAEWPNFSGIGGRTDNLVHNQHYSEINVTAVYGKKACYRYT